MIKHDFRSDTVTRPSTGMLRAMSSARVGDDVLGDDPTVQALEAMMSRLLGKEAALFLPSGTQSNLVALMAHCQRGDEYIVGQEAHCYRWEGGGAAVIGSIQPQPIQNRADGGLDPADVEAAIKPDDPHFAITRLLALENTIGGKVVPMDQVTELVAIARRHGLGAHLDGARVLNAAAALRINVAEVAQPFDTVSVCLSKGLGAPVGSVLVGSAHLIARARRIRKMVGGSLRQVGLLAAAGIYALEYNLDRLEEDHRNAERLAQGLAQVPGLRVEQPQTNMVFVELDPMVIDQVNAALASEGIAVGSSYGGRRQRWVTHLDVSESAIECAIRAVQSAIH